MLGLYVCCSDCERNIEGITHNYGETLVTEFLSQLMALSVRKLLICWQPTHKDSIHYGNIFGRVPGNFFYYHLEMTICVASLQNSPLVGRNESGIIAD